MNLELKSIDEEFTKCLIEKFNDELGGVHYIFRFPNNYGASVIKSKYTYGGDEDLWEMALLYFHNLSKWDYELVYEKDFEGDVMGYLSDGKVNEVLKKIIKY